MPKSDAIRLQHMLDATRKAIEVCQDRERSDLDTDDLLALARVRLLEVLGEAANKVEADVRARYADIPWRSIISARNRFIHGYDDVDLDIVWNIVKVDLPPLVRAMEAALENEQSDTL